MYGAGAMGTVLGGFLSDCGLDAQVDLISRNRGHVEAMKDKGARIVCAATGIRLPNRSAPSCPRK